MKAERGLILHDQAAVKTVTFNGCTISSINFVGFFHNLIVLKLDNCKLIQPLQEIYETIGELKALMSLSLIGVKNNLPNQDIFLGYFFTAVQGLPKL